ncbi:hypothetical protein FI667_g13683, partial [Globisporangium splendens]
MDSKGADDRFYTPRSSARRGYSSTGPEDERFTSSRESARSVSSDDNDYVTPRESLALPTESCPVAANDSYSTSASSSSKRFPGVSEMKHALSGYGDPKYELKL